MALGPGRQLLHYRLIEKIGEGGMGVVWKASDTTLNRDVAIKVLPDALSEDPERLTRFEREAKLLASIQHPNIATLHGLHESDGLRFLAMELVAGEDLAERLARGPLPLREAVDAAVQIAEALAAAHDAGVMHRDLKPANVRIDFEGQVKVLDFGLAKAIAPETPESVSPELSPTLTSAGTVAGVILGTAAYMSPEQARGRPVDRRSDVWAFGCVLYEMLTSAQAFPGETVSDMIAAILAREPDWSRLPAEATPRLRRVLQRCLCKDLRERTRDLGDVALDLREALQDEGPGQAAPAVATFLLAPPFLSSMPLGEFPCNVFAESSAVLGAENRIGSGFLPLAASGFTLLRLRRRNLDDRCLCHSHPRLGPLRRSAQSAVVFDDLADESVGERNQHHSYEDHAHESAEEHPPGVRLLNEWSLGERLKSLWRGDN